ncbi:MAG: 2-C-methyl-D-erythritol 2,4-cyclodiphosphate synthase [Bacillota bacterium]|nr:2-C-methyl-D-erythritol 2,4-cyclodiphosphate synthase [Clostridia bacterium]
MRVGFGYDVHRLVRERKLILGGVEIPYEYGLLGHSDADVLVHALMDALLGALALGDIGKHFPDTDPQFKGISSMLLLKEVKKLLQEKGYRVNNADILVVAEHPKLAPFIEAMRENIADMLETETDRINIKATTTEGLGFTGTGEGMAAYAVVTICKNPAS